MAIVAPGCWAALKPLARPAMTMLAASRLTSHSQGPGSVSSKSLASNTSRRSGEAKMPKLERCASPLACTTMSVRGVSARSKAMHRGGAAVVGEGRLGHTRVAQRHQVGQAVRLLALEDGDGIAIGRRLERGVARARHALAHEATLLHAGRMDGPRAGRSRRRLMAVPGPRPRYRWPVGRLAGHRCRLLQTVRRGSIRGSPDGPLVDPRATVAQAKTQP